MYPTYDETQAAAIQSMQDSRGDYRRDRNNQRMLDMMGTQVRGSNLNQEQIDNYSSIVDPTGNYNPSSVMSDSQRNYVNDNLDAQLALEDIAMGNMGVSNLGLGDQVKAIMNFGPSFQNPSTGAIFNGVNRPPSVGGSYGGSLTTGGLSNVTGIPGILGTLGASVYGGINPEGAVNLQTNQLAKRNKKQTSSALKQEMAKQANSRAQIDNERDSYY